MKQKQTRREFMKMAGAAAVMAAMNPDFSSTIIPKTIKDRNILFICLDDLNDWTGCLGGHPLVKTPNIDRIAASGVLFTDAHCASPLCNPSRTAVLTGVSPSTSGVHDNSMPFRSSPVLKNATTIPQHFRTVGYKAMRAGKVLHNRDSQSWDETWPPGDSVFPKGNFPRWNTLPLSSFTMEHEFDWGPLDIPVEDMADMKVASRVSEWLEEKQDSPFFIGCGFVKPHLPLYVPRKYFDMYPLEKIEIKVDAEKDVKDISPWVLRKVSRPDQFYRGVMEHDLWKSAVQGYLAAISFADDCVGKVYEALERSEYFRDTIVVLWSDHGFHLGEKMHWAKSTLWKESTRSLLAMSAPGLIPKGVRSDSVVSLMDIYPTLAEMCGLSTPFIVEGESLCGIIRNPMKRRSKPVISTTRVNNHSVRTDEWCYIKYSNGDRELYDRVKDPEEWTNLAGKKKYKKIISELEKWVPGNRTKK